MNATTPAAIIATTYIATGTTLTIATDLGYSVDVTRVNDGYYRITGLTAAYVHRTVNGWAVDCHAAADTIELGETHTLVPALHIALGHVTNSKF